MVAGLARSLAFPEQAIAEETKRDVASKNKETKRQTAGRSAASKTKETKRQTAGQNAASKTKETKR